MLTYIYSYFSSLSVILICFDTEAFKFGNLSLELHDVPIFRWGSDTLGTLSLYSAHILVLRGQPWRCTYFGAELAFVAGMFLLKDP